MQWLIVGVKAPKFEMPLAVAVGGLLTTFVVAREPQRAAAGPGASTFSRDPLNTRVAALAGAVVKTSPSANPTPSTFLIIHSPNMTPESSTQRNLLLPPWQFLWETRRSVHEGNLNFSSIFCEFIAFGSSGRQRHTFADTAR